VLLNLSVKYGLPFGIAFAFVRKTQDAAAPVKENPALEKY